MTTTPAPVPTRASVSSVLRERPVIAVLRANDPCAYDAVVDVLVENGIRSIELTLTTPGTLEHLSSLLERFTDAEIGVGTVTTVDEALCAIDAGAHYLVTPVLDTAVIRVAVEAGIPVYPGALTPTEVFAAWQAGAAAVKIFPAETVGAQYGTHLRGPFPGIEFIPSGGVALDDIPAWLQAGAAAVSLGGPLIGDALKGGSLEALANRCRRVVAIVEQEAR
ncbi:MAG: 2-dehydro-3-deoxyphosphogluconate aldolase [Subtercola sp.]|nr:2-dehydro-3-deoxyphosphogluconate aldolase [Subtercola sp.]